MPVSREPESNPESKSYMSQCQFVLEPESILTI